MGKTAEAGQTTDFDTVPAACPHFPTIDTGTGSGMKAGRIRLASGISSGHEAFMGGRDMKLDAVWRLTRKTENPFITTPFYCYTYGMRKIASLLLVSALLASNLGASVFSGYDFTFFKSVSDSIAVMDSEKVGVDYTGYGFLGDMTSGVFLRLGIQSPFTTLLAPFEDLGKEQETGSGVQPAPLAATSGLNDDATRHEFTVLFAFGPAFRRFVSTTLSWYLGLGIKVEQDITNISPTTSKQNGTKIIENSVATDIDMGFRLSTEGHTTLRIGVYLTRPLFILTETRSRTDGLWSGKDSEFKFQQNIFTARDGKIQWDVQGYISLGHTYASFQKEERYRYTIRSGEIFTGSLEKM